MHACACPFQKRLRSPKGRTGPGSWLADFMVRVESEAPLQDWGSHYALFAKVGRVVVSLVETDSRL